MQEVRDRRSFIEDYILAARTAAGWLGMDRRLMLEAVKEATEAWLLIDHEAEYER